MNLFRSALISSEAGEQILTIHMVLCRYRGSLFLALMSRCQIFQMSFCMQQKLTIFSLDTEQQHSYWNMLCDLKFNDIYWRTDKRGTVVINMGLWMKSSTSQRPMLCTYSIHHQFMNVLPPRGGLAVDDNDDGLWWHETRVEE